MSINSLLYSTFYYYIIIENNEKKSIKDFWKYTKSDINLDFARRQHFHVGEICETMLIERSSSADEAAIKSGCQLSTADSECISLR